MTDESVTKGAESVEKRVNARHCPFCGAEHWNLMPDIEGFIGSRTATDTASEEAIPPITRYPAVSYNCGQCGFVRTHILPD
jgi:hypothetical protein